MLPQLLRNAHDFPRLLVDSSDPEPPLGATLTREVQKPPRSLPDEALIVAIASDHDLKMLKYRLYYRASMKALQLKKQLVLTQAEYPTGAQNYSTSYTSPEPEETADLDIFGKHKMHAPSTAADLLVNRQSTSILIYDGHARSWSKELVLT
ncbi:hypothetical protein ACHAO7_011850 [Fusarium culmorum]